MVHPSTKLFPMTEFVNGGGYKGGKHPEGLKGCEDNVVSIYMCVS
jgi:hypothetical protein